MKAESPADLEYFEFEYYETRPLDGRDSSEKSRFRAGGGFQRAMGARIRGDCKNFHYV